MERFGLKHGGMRWRRVSAEGLWLEARKRDELDNLNSPCLSLSPFSSPCFLHSSLSSYGLPSWWTPGLLSLPLISLSLFSHNLPADRRSGAMMDDALSESDNIFSQSPKPDRAASEAGRCWPSFTVCEVQLLCSVTPLTTPISAALGLCKLELTTRPCLLKICTPPCHNI